MSGTKRDSWRAMPNRSAASTSCSCAAARTAGGTASGSAARNRAGRRSFGGVDRAVVETLAARVLRRDQQRLVGEPAHDVEPLALRLRPHVELRELDRAAHGGAGAEGRQAPRRRPRSARSRLLPLSDRLCRQHAVEADLAGERGVDRRRLRRGRPRGGERARLPVAPCRILRLATAAWPRSRPARRATRRPAARHARAMRAAHRTTQHCPPRDTTPRRADGAGARRGKRSARSRRAVGFGQKARAASPRRRGHRRRRCAPHARARRARGPGRPAASSGIRRWQAPGPDSRRHARIPARDPVGGRQVHGDRLREAKVAGFGRQAEARASILDGQVALRDQRGKQRRAGLRRRLAREPERFRVRERDVAVALAAILDPEARKLDILTRRRRVVGRRTSTSRPRFPSIFSQSTRRRSASGDFGQRGQEAPICSSVAVSSRSIRCQYST